MADNFNRQYTDSPSAMFGAGDFANSGAPGSSTGVADGPASSLGTVTTTTAYGEPGDITASVQTTDTNSGSGRMSEDISGANQGLDPSQGHAWVPRGPQTFRQPR